METFLANPDNNSKQQKLIKAWSLSVDRMQQDAKRFIQQMQSAAPCTVVPNFLVTRNEEVRCHIVDHMSAILERITLVCPVRLEIEWRIQIRLEIEWRIQIKILEKLQD